MTSLLIKKPANKYKALESTMIRYQDLLNIESNDNQEAFVVVKQQVIPYGYRQFFSDMAALLDDKIIVRKTVYEKLQSVQKSLKKTNPNYTLYLTYGYRDLEIQTKRFLEQLKDTTTTFYSNPYTLYEEVHRFIAVPTVAGHPTGGAVDILIKDTKANSFLDFGSPQYDYSTKDCYVFADDISQQAKDNRMLLRSLMLEAGFAPFDGEWWHFSYGDREWALYYQFPFAIYSQISYKDIRIKGEYGKTTS